MAAMMRRGYKELLKEAVEKLKGRLAAGQGVQQVFWGIENVKEVEC